ncbi:hypothetical protein J3Q64DRAFT_1844458 [Phycomyces blakesleeanus]|uniref:GST C-terminal domain-containing protein n=2 Tax=Phycomyces blakesleeanus TaxID=4837 RepID=A0A162NDZ6_PHYB8|nr:hypothetical protein PHYBLDRAFT_150264 [Phycomyces blakesleeanus NRRL 1555(-)]OAD68674.1 hypothetical protein PHYBLDRAFT_150264 [Phycomyces blakesleeanus NRRL 1555(-)]|eukprot:XP_018286714.1 hypothetical protein PHYBLDRAFT_150264 [Phycomyces blakesleeanus NRRL 1555(-)]
MKPIQFYDLLLPALGEKAWSPNTYKTRFTLNIKKLPYETTWVTFKEIYTLIPDITKTGNPPTVPIIVDTEKEKAIQDSLKIAQYLEVTYPESPSLFHGDEELHRSFQATFDTRLVLHLICIIVLKVVKACGDEAAQARFREVREAKYGKTVEQFAGDPEDHIKQIHEVLKDTRKILAEKPYLTGSKVGWADITLASQLRTVDALDHELFDSRILDDTNGGKSLREWYERMSVYA